MRHLLSHLVSVLVSGVTIAATAQVPATFRPDPRAVELVSKMTLEEKINFLSGGSMMGTQALDRLSIPVFRMSDGPVGAHVPPPSTAIGGGIGLAASWDTKLAEDTGRQLGRDARSRGVNFLLGPGVNIYRTPLNGRNFEYFGEDPFLASRIAVNYINGVQSMGVSATVKHFLGNNSEYARYTSDSVIDEHTLHEIYMPVFEAAVKEARVGAVMSSYNKTNGTYMSQNGPIVMDVLKGSWGFQGVYMSDWTATHDGIAAVNNGLDLEMPFGTYMNSSTLLPAVKAGVVKEAEIDEHVERLLTLAYRMDWMKDQQMDLSISRFDRQGMQVALRNAEEGTVLLKNDGTLPVDANAVKTIAVLGQDAYPSVPSAGGSGYVAPYHSISLLEGVSAHFPDATVTYARGVNNINHLALQTPFCVDAEGKKRGVTVEKFSGKSPHGKAISTRIEPAISQGAGFNSDPETQPDYSTITADQMKAMISESKDTSERWVGYYTAAESGDYIAFAQTLGQFRLIVDGEIEIDNKDIPHAALNQKTVHLAKGSHKFVIETYGIPPFFGNMLRAGIVERAKVVDPYALELAKRADVVVIGAGYTADNETEGGDRMFDLPVGQDELIEAAAAVNKHTVVAITSGGSVDVASWLDKVAGVFELWYPGQEGGTAFAELLSGAKNPSGHLPISWERKLEDNPSVANYWYTDAKTEEIAYREGVFVGYRGYDHAHREPLFPFGYGLSYTTFEMSGLKVTPDADAGNYTVSVEIKNTGKRDGAAVAELYVQDPNAAADNAAQELKAFAREEVAPGDTKTVTMKLSARSFTHFDVKSKKWHAAAGDRTIRVGSSESDLPLHQTVRLAQALDVPE